MGKKARAKRERRDAESARSRHTSGIEEVRRWLPVLVLLIAVAAVGLAIAMNASKSPGQQASRSDSQNSSADTAGIDVGRKVPDIASALPASTGRSVDLHKFRGKKLVVYFYEGVT